MTAYHATHESPYADDCPDCAGYTEDAPRSDHRVYGLAAAACLIGAVALVVIAAWWTR